MKKRALPLREGRVLRLCAVFALLLFPTKKLMQTAKNPMISIMISIAVNIPFLLFLYCHIKAASRHLFFLFRSLFFLALFLSILTVSGFSGFAQIKIHFFAFFRFYGAVLVFHNLFFQDCCSAVCHMLDLMLFSSGYRRGFC